MFLSAVLFIIKIYPNVELHLGAPECAVTGNWTTAKQPALRGTLDTIIPSDLSLCMSMLELGRNTDSATYQSIQCISIDSFKFVRQPSDFVILPCSSYSLICKQYFIDILQVCWHMYIHTQLHCPLSVSIHETCM